MGDLVETYDEFKKEGCEIYSVSTDTHFSHKAWHDASRTVQKVRFPMIADPTQQLCKMFGVLNEEEGTAHRASFVIAPNGEIMAYEVHHPSVGRNSRELLRKVQAAKFTVENDGESCPAKWTSGQPTLRSGIGLVGKL